MTRRANQVPIYGSHVKPRNEKYFALSESQISSCLWASCSGQRGVAHVTTRDRDAVDVDAMETNVAEAYGKSVWSRRRGAGVNAPAGSILPGATEAKEPFSGESTS